MRPDSVFVAAYSAVLLMLSLGLHRLGRVNTYPWTSRALAGYRRATGDRGGTGPAVKDASSDWPHIEVPRLHTGIALVAACAATLLTTVELVRHHRLEEVAVLGAVLSMGIVIMIRLVQRFR
jgi:hypothetical protein